MEKKLKEKIINSLKKHTGEDKIIVLSSGDCGSFEHITLSLGSSTTVDFIIQIVRRYTYNEIWLHQVYPIDSFVSSLHVKSIEDALKECSNETDKI